VARRAFLSGSILFAVLAIVHPSSAPAQSPGGWPVTFEADLRLSDQPFTRAVHQREPTIAVNPKDSLNLVAGFFDRLPSVPDRVCRVTFTRDGGKTWTLAGFVPKQNPNNGCGDPSLAADLEGSFYYAYLESNIAPDGSLLTTDIGVARSTDGGATFPTATIAFRGTTSPFLDSDKPYVAVDTRPKSRFRGTIYLSWSLFNGSGIQIVVQSSKDRGATWSPPVAISPVRGGDTEQNVQFSLPVVAPDGTAYVFYMDYDRALLTSGLNLRYVRSTDGGRRWSKPITALGALPSPGSATLRNADRDYGIKPGNRGIIVFSYPSVAIAPDGTIYVAWIDYPSGSCGRFEFDLRPHCENSDLRLSVSRDAGKTWSAPVKVTDETNDSDQFLHWIAVHPDGLVSLVWLDKRLDPLNENFDAFYTNTRDGKTFLPNVRLSSVSSEIGTFINVGDYNNIAATAAGAFPIWGDLRSATDLEVFTATGDLAPR